MPYLTLTEIIDSDGVIDEDRLQTIDDIIQALLITRRGTIPGSRSFGLSGTFIDANNPDAVNIIAVDLSEALAVYAPEIDIDRVELTEADTDGTMGLKVYIEGR